MSVQSSSHSVEDRLLALLRQQPEFQPICPRLPDVVRLTVAIACVDTPADPAKAAEHLLIPTAVFLSQLQLFQQEETVGHVPVRDALVQAIMLDKTSTAEWEAGDIGTLRELVDTVLRKAGDLGYAITRQQELTLEDIDAIEG